MSTVSHVQPREPDPHADPAELGDEIHLDHISQDDEKKIVDAFLSADAPERDTEDVEIVSWSRRLGAPFVVTLQELTEKEMSDIFERFTDIPGKRGKVKEVRQTEQAAHIVAAAWVAPDIQARTGEIFYRFLQHKFKPLELAAMAAKVMELSGGSDDAVITVKNSSGVGED